MHESESESEVAQLCLTLRDPVDCSPPGSSIHGIFQARVLEWGAIAFSTVHAHMISKLEVDTFLTTGKTLGLPPVGLGGTVSACTHDL